MDSSVVRKSLEQMVEAHEKGEPIPIPRWWVGLPEVSLQEHVAWLATWWQPGDPIPAEFRPELSARFRIPHIARRP